MTERGEFLFQRPDALVDVSDSLQLGFAVAALSARLAVEKRTLVNHPDGRAENVAEHSHMVGLVAVTIAQRHFPDLDTGLVSLYCQVHDLLEAYVGDTPTHNISIDGLAIKGKLEATALQRFSEEYADIPELVDLVRSYEEQIVPEARYIRIIDKIVPHYKQFLDGGATLREGIDKEEHFAHMRNKSLKLQEEYPEYTELLEQLRYMFNSMSDTLF